MQLCVLTRVPYGEHDITNMYRLPNAHESLVTSSLVVGAITMGAGMHADPHTGQRQLASQSPRWSLRGTSASQSSYIGCYIDVTSLSKLRYIYLYFVAWIIH